VDTVTLSDARAHLSELVDRAAAGEEVCITRQGRPVARLVPMASDRKPIDVGALRAMISATPESNAEDVVRRMRDEARY
jgi:prevent-host-death family protein